MNNLKVLSLEDDPQLSLVMEHYFQGEGYKFTTVTTGQDCLESIQSDQYDIVLMDLGLPDMDGLGLMAQIKNHYQGPIIIVSGKSSITDRVVGLEMGADDYVIKPFEMRELMARIKANVRRQVDPIQNNENSDEAEALLYEFDDFVYDDAKLSLTHNKDGVIDLTSGECKLLSLFLNSNGRALSREYLYEQTRDHSYESFDRAVDITVTRLRKKLNDDPNHPNIIKTIRGTGYMFIADIKKSPTN